MSGGNVLCLLLASTGVVGCNVLADVTAGLVVRSLSLPFRTNVEGNVGKGPAAREPGLTVTGRIVDLDSGEALAGVVVGALVSERVTETTTDASGGFRLAGLPRGREVAFRVVTPSTSFIPEQLPFALPAAGLSVDLGAVRLLRGPDRTQVLKHAQSWGLLGLHPVWRDRRVVVAHVFQGSSAQQAGVHVGDTITAVESRDVRGCGSGAVSWLMGRRPGDIVSITAHGNDGSPRNVTLRAVKR